MKFSDMFTKKTNEICVNCKLLNYLSNYLSITATYKNYVKHVKQT